jgi:hypothetical protein
MNNHESWLLDNVYFTDQIKTVLLYKINSNSSRENKTNLREGVVLPVNTKGNYIEMIIIVH